MRIDDENKVVWCSEEEMEWYVRFNSSHEDNLGSLLKLIEVLSAERELVLPSPMDRNYRINLIKAIANHYEFKLEKPKKYCWRKKKEYLAHFEDVSEGYLNINDLGNISLGNRFDVRTWRTFFTEQEAREILENDFDMFEKVEVD